MDATRRSQVAFHLTAAPAFGSLAPEAALVPALLAPYRDVVRLRHDFPAILTEDGAGPQVQSLTSAFDRALATIAPRGAAGERTRRLCLQLEQELRERIAAGETGRLTALWDSAAAKLGVWTDDTSREILAGARKALAVDGELIGCDPAMPRRLVEHAWRVEQRARLDALQIEIDGLIVTLSDILKADFVRSAPGREPAVLRAAVGTAFQDAFDFEAMSRVLTRGKPVASTLPKSRRARIEWALSVLRAPPLPAPGGDLEKGLNDFIVDSPSTAAKAFRKRLPRVIDLIKAMAIARLEAEGRYVEAEHDPFFAGFGPGALTRDDLARFPEHLVCLGSERKSEDLSALVELLSADIPVKVLVIAEDAVGASPAGDGAPTLAAAKLGPMALGLDDVFVLQAPASHLVAMADRLNDGLAFRGAALFTVFAPAATPGGLAPYLVAAAALQARAFPAFVYDPSAGPTMAERLSLDANPQPDAEWATLDLVYEDAAHQRQHETIAFTFADFMLCLPAQSQHFARASGATGLVAVADWIAGAVENGEQAAPFTWALGADGKLERVVVHEKIVVAARRCRDQWHHLRDLATPPARATAPAVVAAAPAAAPVKPAAPAAAEEAESKAPASDEPYIETARCTSCNECIRVNGKLFVYNAEKQATIGDVNGGSYRDLVEAAEGCPVSIIHPGKPRNPKEPGLDELVQRAEPFR